MQYKKSLIISGGKKLFRIILDSDSLLDVSMKNREVEEVTYKKGSKYVEGSEERSYSKTYSLSEVPEKYLIVLKESGLSSWKTN